MTDLSIIIVSYNTKDFIKNCLASILDSIKGNVRYEIIVVDNASSDGSKDMIEKEFLNRHSGNQAPPEHPESLMAIGDSGQDGYQTGEYHSVPPSPEPTGSGTVTRQARMTEDVEVIFIQNKKNLGFSAANNIGIKHASGKYILFLNPDTIVYPNTLETMVEFMDNHKDMGAATCKVVMPTGEIDDASHRGFPTPWNSFAYFSGLSKIFPRSRLFGGYNLGWLDLRKTHEIEALAGAFMLVRREAGQELQWWDEDYFFYGEDLDFCYKLKQKKWKIYYVPQASILHYKGISGGIKKHSQHLTTADKETKLRATKARFEAMKIFYNKHYLKKYPHILTWLVFCGINIKLWFASKKV